MFNESKSQNMIKINDILLATRNSIHGGCFDDKNFSKGVTPRFNTLTSEHINFSSQKYFKLIQQIVIKFTTPQRRDNTDQ